MGAVSTWRSGQTDRDIGVLNIAISGRKSCSLWGFIDTAKVDILFDQWFAELPEEKLSELKKKGVTLAHLVKHPSRIDLIAYDIWTHYKAYAKPDGFKAQVVAYDREAVILYKRALNKVVAEDLIEHQGMSPEEAAKEAEKYSTCVYSQSQEDGKPNEDTYVADVREDLERYYLDKTAEIDAKSTFKVRTVL